jgi:predicted xylose isomerase-like sugar epimerase
LAPILISNIVLDGELTKPVDDNVLACVGCVAGAEQREFYFRMLADAGLGEVEILKDIDSLEMTERASPAEVLSIMAQNGISREDVAGIVRPVTYRTRKAEGPSDSKR